MTERAGAMIPSVRFRAMLDQMLTEVRRLRGSRARLLLRPHDLSRWCSDL